MLIVGHGKKLEESIISETSGNLKRLLVALLQANRPEGNTIDRRKARNDAKALFEAGEKKFGTDESRFNVILCSRLIFTICLIICIPVVKYKFQLYLVPYSQRCDTNADIEIKIQHDNNNNNHHHHIPILPCYHHRWY